MAQKQVQSKTIDEFESLMIKNLEYCDYVISGLENYGPYQKVIEQLKENRHAIDKSWHLVGDPAKLHELRVSKMAYSTLIDYIDNLKRDRERFRSQLTKYQEEDGDMGESNA